MSQNEKKSASMKTVPDTIYDREGAVLPFEFNQDVARAFDNMATRSIPFYHTVIQFMADFIRMQPQLPKRIIDLGCSTGNSLLALYEALENRAPSVEWIGVDQSQAMIDQAKEKFSQLEHEHPIHFECQRIEAIEFKSGDIVLLNYVLQFIEKNERALVLKKIASQIAPHGILFVSEKIAFAEENLQDTVKQIYEDFKFKNGYSRLAIAQKRKALENVLVPMSYQENVTLLKSAGFKTVSSFFQWGNFVSYLALTSDDSN